MYTQTKQIGHRKTVIYSISDFSLQTFATSFYKWSVNHFRVSPECCHFHLFFSPNKIYNILYSFSKDAVTNCYKCNGLKHHHFIAL